MTDVTLDAAELHARARDVNAAAPQPFRSAVIRLERAERERTDALLVRDDLIRQARNLGVSWVALARWTGISPRRLYEIVEDR